MLQHVTHFHQSQRTCWSSTPVKSAPKFFQSFEEISQTCMPVQRCLMKLLLIFNTKENNEKKDWTKWKLSILERCRRAGVCGFWFCDRKFVHDVIQWWTASWNTQKAAPDHIYALYNLAAQLIPTEARNYSFTLQEKYSAKIFRFTQQQTNSEYIFLSLKREIYHYGRILFVSKAPEAILETQNLLHTVNFQWEYSLQNHTWQSRNWSPSEVYKHHHKNRIVALSMCLMNCCKSWILFCNFLLLSLYVQGI
jgi:hypothetical protein